MFLLHSVTILLFAFSLVYAIILCWIALRSFQRQRQAVDVRDAKISLVSCLLIPIVWSAVAIAQPICLILGFILLYGEDLFSGHLRWIITQGI